MCSVFYSSHGQQQLHDQEDNFYMPPRVHGSLKQPSKIAVIYQSVLGLYLVVRVPEELWTEIPNTVQEVVIKPSSRNRNAKRQKWLSEEGLQELRKEEKWRAKETRKYTHIWMQSSEKQQGEIRKPSYMINAKKQRETIEWERIEISLRKLEIPREHAFELWC